MVMNGMSHSLTFNANMNGNGHEFFCVQMRANKNKSEYIYSILMKENYNYSTQMRVNDLSTSKFLRFNET
jgi:hypothetical protein